MDDLIETGPTRTPFRGIYAIRHKDSGKVYVGSAKDFRSRWRDHRNDLRRGVHKSRHLQAAWNLYGADAFVFEVLEGVESADDLVRVEQEYLDHFEPWRRRNGYNTHRIAQSALGVKRSTETRRKLSESHTGKSRPPLSPEHRAKISATRKANPPTPDQIARLVHAAKNKSPETREKLSVAGRERKISPDHLRRLVNGRMATPVSPETKARLSALNKGKKPAPLTEEGRARIVAANKGKPKPPHVVEMLAAYSRSRKKKPDTSQMVLCFDPSNNGKE